jgi:hypothetical protein
VKYPQRVAGDRANSRTPDRATTATSGVAGACVMSHTVGAMTAPATLGAIATRPPHAPRPLAGAAKSTAAAAA